MRDTRCYVYVLKIELHIKTHVGWKPSFVSGVGVFQVHKHTHAAHTLPPCLSWLVGDSAQGSMNHQLENLPVSVCWVPEPRRLPRGLLFGSAVAS